MNEKDNARYWTEYHNLDVTAYRLMHKIRRNIDNRKNNGLIDEEEWYNEWRCTWDGYEQDEAKREFKQRFNKHYGKYKWWMKIGKKLGIWDEKYIKGPNEEMECLACGKPLKNEIHNYLDCSTKLIYMSNDVK